MQSARLMTFLCALALFSVAGASTNPLLKVLELLTNFESKLQADEEAEAKAMEQYTEYCKDMAVKNDFDTKTLTTQADKLKAEIEKTSSEIDVADSEITSLASTISASSSKLEEATSMRKAERSTFEAQEKQLLEMIDTFERAIEVIEKEMQKKAGSSFAQLQNGLSNVLSTLGTLVDAAGLSVGDRAQLLALVQSTSGDSDDDEFGAPAADAYESHSSGILDTLTNLKDKAEDTLAELRKAESESAHTFALLKQSLEDETAARNKNLDDVKGEKASAQEDKAAAEGDLKVTEADLKSTMEKRSVANARCMQGAADHDKSVEERKKELDAIQSALKILKETAGGAADKTYSLLQLTSKGTSKSVSWSKTPALLKQLAKRHHSAALAQLASRVSAVVRFSASNHASPFEKVKGLIQDLIAKLQAEAADESKEKAFCDSEMAKTQAKKEELGEDLQKLTTKIDSDASKSVALQNEIKEVQTQMADIQQEQGEAQEVRASYHAEYVSTKADLEAGLGGVQQALTVLRDYYAKSGGAALVQEDDATFNSFMQQPSPPQGHTADGGAGDSIIGLLEIMESDFATGLTDAENQEATYQELYDKATQERKKIMAIKEADVKYKTREYKALDKDIADLSSDRDTVSEENAAVVEYYGKLTERCIAKPETYEERKARREAEVEGLKEAMAALESEAALLQRTKRNHGLRGARMSTEDE